MCGGIERSVKSLHLNLFNSINCQCRRSSQSFPSGSRSECGLVWSRSSGGHFVVSGSKLGLVSKVGYSSCSFSSAICCLWRHGLSSSLLGRDCIWQSLLNPLHDGWSAKVSVHCAGVQMSPAFQKLLALVREHSNQGPKAVNEFW